VILHVTFIVIITRLHACRQVMYTQVSYMYMYIGYVLVQWLSTIGLKFYIYFKLYTGRERERPSHKKKTGLLPCFRCCIFEHIFI